jgi:hypothetical protein
LYLGSWSSEGTVVVGGTVVVVVAVVRTVTGGRDVVALSA